MNPTREKHLTNVRSTKREILVSAAGTTTPIQTPHSLRRNAAHACGPEGASALLVVAAGAAGPAQAGRAGGGHRVRAPSRPLDSLMAWMWVCVGACPLDATALARLRARGMAAAQSTLRAAPPCARRRCACRFVAADELIEVTPEAVRLRKVELHTERRRAAARRARQRDQH